MPDRRWLSMALQEPGRLLGGMSLEAPVAEWTDRLTSADVGASDLVRVLSRDPTEALHVAIAALARGSAVWVSPGGRPTAQDDAATLVVADDAVVRRRPPDVTLPAAIALVQETSGSSAEPRPACRSVASVLCEAAGYREGLGLAPGVRLRVAAAATHSFGCGVVLAGLLAGCDVDASAVGTPARLARQLQDAPFDILATTPAMAGLLTQTPALGGRAGPALLLIGAGVASQDLEARLTARFGTRVIRGYGSTETGGTFLGHSGLGKPIAGVAVASPGLGEVGELVLETDTPVLGYLGTSLRRSRLWPTGDRVWRAEDASLAFLGRVEQDRLRLNGAFVDVQEVRRAGEAVPGVAAVVVLVMGRPGASELEDLWVVVAGDGLSAATLHEVVDVVLPTVPVRLRVMPQLPLNDIGKLDRARLLNELQRV